MPRSPLLLALMIGAPLLAGNTFALDVSLNRFPWTSRSSAHALPGGSYSRDFAPAMTSGFGLNFAWGVVRFKPMTLDLTASYRFHTTSDVAYTSRSWAVTYPPTPATVVRGTARLRLSQEALGARLAGHAWVDWGLGLQCRIEHLRVENGSAVLGDVEDVEQIRPWAEGHVGYTFTTGHLHPFVSLSLAAPLTSTKAPSGFDVTDGREDFVRSMGPKSEVALHVGMRF